MNLIFWRRVKSSSSAWRRIIATTPAFDVGLSTLSGCTALIVYSPNGVYGAHFFEDQAWGSGHANFQEFVVDFLQNGRDGFPGLAGDIAGTLRWIQSRCIHPDPSTRATRRASQRPWISTRSGGVPWSHQRTSTRAHSNNPPAPEPCASEFVRGPRWRDKRGWIKHQRRTALSPRLHRERSSLIPIRSQKLRPEICKAILRNQPGV